jgi:hypothetical protein
VTEITGSVAYNFFSMALPAHSGPWPLIQFRNHFYTDGRTPWTSDQPVARPLPKHTTKQTQNKRIHTPNIHASSRNRAHDPSGRASEDSSCLRPRGYCDRLHIILHFLISVTVPALEKTELMIQDKKKASSASNAENYVKEEIYRIRTCLPLYTLH